MQLSLQAKQQMQLTMTPQLRQAIDMLHYSIDEMDELLAEENERSPLITIQLRRTHSKRPKSNESSEPQWVEPSSEQHGDNSISYDELAQLARLQFHNQQERQLVLALLPYIQSNGYLDTEAVPLQRTLIEKGVTLLQQIGPPGIGAMSVEQCLYFQAKEAEIENKTLVLQIIQFHLQDLAKQQLKEIATECEVTLEEVVDAIQEIRTLQPYPCQIDTYEKVDTLIPDVIIERDGDALFFSIHPTYAPTITFHQPEHWQHYDEEAKQFVRDQQLRYYWLKRSLEKRYETLHRFMSHMIDRQRAFFMQGETELQPLTMREVAEKLNVHESTISRVTMNKWLETPHGIYPFKQLFQPKIKTATGAVSRTKVQHLIQHCIEEENPEAPLSDQQIAAHLAFQHEIKISRRTVQKYREALGISSSRMRKQLV